MTLWLKAQNYNILLAKKVSTLAHRGMSLNKTQRTCHVNRRHLMYIWSIYTSCSNDVYLTAPTTSQQMNEQASNNGIYTHQIVFLSHFTVWRHTKGSRKKDEKRVDIVIYDNDWISSGIKFISVETNDSFINKPSHWR